EQFIVGDAAPQEERQAGCQLEIADSVDTAGGDALWFVFHPEEELRIDEHRAQRLSNSSVEILLSPALAIKRHRTLDVRIRDRPAIGAPHQRGENRPGAGFLLAGHRFGTAHEKAAAAPRGL